MPPTLTSSRHVMTVLFVADEGVADDGFFATYQARNATESRYTSRDKGCSEAQMRCAGTILAGLQGQTG